MCSGGQHAVAAGCAGVREASSTARPCERDAFAGSRRSVARRTLRGRALRAGQHLPGHRLLPLGAREGVGPGLLERAGFLVNEQGPLRAEFRGRSG